MTSFYSTPKKLIISNSDKDSKRSELSTDDCVLVLPNKGMKYTIARSLENKSGFVRTVLQLSGTLTLNGSGALLAAPVMDPSSSGEWSSWATLFDEFRVLSAVFRVVPVLGSATKGLLAVAFDNDDVTAPTTIDEILSYQNHKLVPLYKGLSYKAVRPNVTSSAYWTDVASPSTQPGSVKMVIAVGDASTGSSYYSMQQTVEFRGRR